MSPQTCYFAIWNNCSIFTTTDPHLISEISEAFEEIKEKVPKTKYEISKSFLTFDGKPLKMEFKVPGWTGAVDHVKIETWLFDKLFEKHWELFTITFDENGKIVNYVFRKFFTPC